MIEAGDVHADLWEGLTFLGRWIAGPEDVTIGIHGQYGLCAISHHGYEDQILWVTTVPICRADHPTRNAQPHALDKAQSKMLNDVLSAVLNATLPDDELNGLLAA
ncbi:hypothetical protein ABS772_06165 [Methylorubrum podarium]|uniref:Uncharacterized protein n=1 Tax=Methylorubrum podarium TaxID=200476 RepID=A0ABV1QJD0_9HYPH